MTITAAGAARLSRSAAIELTSSVRRRKHLQQVAVPPTFTISGLQGVYACDASTASTAVPAVPVSQGLSTKRLFPARSCAVKGRS